MIERIRIRNFKSLQDVEIRLNRLNVLIGANGAGKSNFVAFFRFLRALFEQRLGGYVAQEGGAERFLYRGRKVSSYLSADIDFSHKPTISLRLKPTNDNGFWLEEPNSSGGGCLGTDYAKERLNSFTVYQFHDTSSSSPMRLPCQLHDNEYLRGDGSNLAAYLYLLQETEPRAFRLIERTIRLIAPYFKAFKLQPNRLNAEVIRLEWEEVDTDMYLDAQSFSDGTLRFIALCTLLLQPNPPKTIIIDEPELGLHPAAIVRLGALLRTASFQSQVIISTQSTNLLNCFEPEDLLMVDKLDGASQIRRLGEDELRAWLEDYSLGEIWEKNIIGGRP